MWPSIGLVKKYAVPGCQIDDRNGKRHVQKLTESGKMFLHGQVRDMMNRHDPSQVAVRFYQSDGTPLLLNKAWTRMFGSSFVHRKAKAANEFLVDRCFYSGHSSTGEVLSSVVFRDPFSMSEGKKGWNIMAACMNSGPPLRAFGFNGPAISHYVFDRGYYSQMAIMCRQWHFHMRNQNQGDDQQLPNLLDFVTSVGDCLHDCGNGFEWGMKGYMGEETSKDMFVGISSIRNSYSEIMQHMCEWVGVVLCPGDQAKLLSDDTLRATWELLGLDTEVVDQLVHHKLIFIRSQLKVSAEALGYDNDRLDDIVGLLTAVMRFVKFSDSRFLTVGPACRASVASSLLGLQHLIGWLRKVKKVSD